MGCITKKLRGYGFVAQMTQLPIVAMQRTKIVRSRRLFNVSLHTIYLHHKSKGLGRADLVPEHPLLGFYDTRPCDGKLALSMCVFRAS